MMDLGTIKPGAHVVVFTDFDGTLLDNETYSFSAANAALDSLHRHNFPVVLCSSKTRLEVELIQLDIRQRHPFITENGGVIFLSRNYFPFTPCGMRASGRGLDVIDCRTSCWRLAETPYRLANELGICVASLREMSAEEIARSCRVAEAEAHTVKMRDYDEPFCILNCDSASEKRLLAALDDAGLCCTK